MFEEIKILNQVTTLSESNIGNVQWLNQVKEDGLVISSPPHIYLHTLTDKNKFLLEVSNATHYVAILGG